MNQTIKTITAHLPSILRGNVLGTARRRRMAEKLLRFLCVPRQRAKHIVSVIR